MMMTMMMKTMMKTNSTHSFTRTTNLSAWMMMVLFVCLSTTTRIQQVSTFTPISTGTSNTVGHHSPAVELKNLVQTFRIGHDNNNVKLFSSMMYDPETAAAAAATSTSAETLADDTMMMTTMIALDLDDQSIATTTTSVTSQQQRVLLTQTAVETVVVATATVVAALVLFERFDVKDAVVFNTAVITAFHHMTQIPIQLYNSYESTLTVNPVTTKAATSAVVYTIGDIIAQFTEQQSQQVDDNTLVTTDVDLDFPRVVRSLIAGGVGHGPLSHVWYLVCENFFAHTLGWTAWWSVLPKIVVDQVVWGTIWNSLYLLSVGLMEHAMKTTTTQHSEASLAHTTTDSKNLSTLLDDVRSSIFPLFLDGLKLWPFAHIITYGLIPIENRLLWVDAVEIIWVSIMATKAAENKNKHDHDGSSGTTNTDLQQKHDETSSILVTTTLAP
jgi:protein Mpv17